MFPTFGESFTISGNVDTARHALGAQRFGNPIARHAQEAIDKIVSRTGGG